MAIQTYNDLYLHYIAENLGVMFEHAVDIGHIFHYDKNRKI